MGLIDDIQHTLYRYSTNAWFAHSANWKDHCPILTGPGQTVNQHCDDWKPLSRTRRRRSFDQVIKVDMRFWSYRLNF